MDEKDRFNKKKMSGELKFRIAFVVFALALTFYCIYVFASKAIADMSAQDYYANLRENTRAESALYKSMQMAESGRMLNLYELIQTGGRDISVYENVSREDMLRYTEKHKSVIAMAENYGDFYGWIYCEDLDIDYPLMRADFDSYEYYLNHNPDGKPSTSGSILVVSENSPNHEDNINTVIYGHNMINGSMFRGIKVWMDKNADSREVIADRMKIEIYTVDGLYVYEFFSVYRSVDRGFYEKPNFGSSEEYLNYLYTIKDMTTIESSGSYNADSVICTLVTCTNRNEDERYVVHGMLTQTIKSFY